MGSYGEKEKENIRLHAKPIWGLLPEAFSIDIVSVHLILSPGTSQKSLLRANNAALRVYCGLVGRKHTHEKVSLGSQFN